jgi:hypothetical protein
MKTVALFLMAAQALQFTVTDGRGKQTNAVTIEAGPANEDGWQPLHVSFKGKVKGDPVLVWPFDGLAKTPDGPEPVPVIVIQKSDEKALANKTVVAALAAPVVLGLSSAAGVAANSGYSEDALIKAFVDLQSASDPFEKGVGLLYAGKAGEAAEQLAMALKQRQRQLTRVPSEIYPTALLYGRALYGAGKFDDAAVAFLAAAKQRPSSEVATKSRDEALIKAGKADAAGR